MRMSSIPNTQWSVKHRHSLELFPDFFLKAAAFTPPNKAIRVQKDALGAIFMKFKSQGVESISVNQVNPVAA